MDYQALGRHVPHVHSGKVRETFAIGNDLFMPVATDRLSTHNVVHKSIIPTKGEVLTALTVFWIQEVLGDFPHHLVAAGRNIYEFLPKAVREQFPDLHYRALIIKRLDMDSVEYVFRYFMAGSLWKAYKEGRDPYGLELPPGLTLMSKLPGAPVFTPTEKSKTDDPLDSARTRARYEESVATALRAVVQIQTFLAKLGIVLVDTKLEIGEGVLADELFTPDSSRYVRTADIHEGVMPPWLDKEVARQEAEHMWGSGSQTPLTFSTGTVVQVSHTYNDILTLITGMSLSEWRQAEHFDYIR